jgi:hypothetical protein
MSKRPPARRPNEKLSNLILEGGKGQRYSHSGAYEVVSPKTARKVARDTTVIKPSKSPKK